MTDVTLVNGYYSEFIIHRGRLQICRQEQLFTFCYGFFDLSECMCLATLLLVETSAPMINGLLACLCVRSTLIGPITARFGKRRMLCGIEVGRVR